MPESERLEVLGLAGMLLDVGMTELPDDAVAAFNSEDAVDSGAIAAVREHGAGEALAGHDGEVGALAVGGTAVADEGNAIDMPDVPADAVSLLEHAELGRALPHRPRALL